MSDKPDIPRAIRHLRNQLGLSRRTMAEAVGISHVHLAKIETGESSPTTGVLDKFYDRFGIDVYMMAVVLFGDINRFPSSIRWSVSTLVDQWRDKISERIVEIRKRGDA